VSTKQPEHLHANEIECALAKAKSDFAERNPKSHAQMEKAARFMPGGNTRTVLHYDPFPLTMSKGDACYLWDLDEHRYVDFLGEFTAGIYGHSAPAIRAAVERALKYGINLSSYNLLEGQLAKILCERFPSYEAIRFTNSGTEANLMALALAKATTGRTNILVFEGGYHGSVLSFGAGSSPLNVPHDFIRAPYNNPEMARDLIRRNSNSLAAVLVEPMLGAGGCIPGDTEFLALLREETQRSGAILIFDEVMTSRLAPGGRQQQIEILPDLTVTGKYLGGGLSFGAFGGRQELMASFDPRRPDCLSHPGTFNNNVLSMAAGIAGLTLLYTPQAANSLNTRGDRLRSDLNALFERFRAPFQFTGLGSVMNLHATRDQIKRPADTAGADNSLRELFYFDVLADGIFIAHRGLVALSLPIGEQEVAQFKWATEQFLSCRAQLFD
jgi:glutamate-1-semialdehyde 2,1-aminomutase